jgi:hypothetical protein
VSGPDPFGVLKAYNHVELDQMEEDKYDERGPWRLPLGFSFSRLV